MLVRRNSNPNFRSCLFSFQEKPSMNWLLLSTRCRGSDEDAPSCEKLPTVMIGRPELTHEGVVAATLQSPIVLGSNAWSCGKNPSANRFHPYRISLIFVGEKMWT